MTSVPFLSDGPADHSLHVVAVSCQQGAVKRRSNRAEGWNNERVPLQRRVQSLMIFERFFVFFALLLLLVRIHPISIWPTRLHTPLRTQTQTIMSPECSPGCGVVAGFLLQQRLSRLSRGRAFRIRLPDEEEEEAADQAYHRQRDEHRPPVLVWEEQRESDAFHETTTQEVNAIKSAVWGSKKMAGVRPVMWTCPCQAQ